MDWLRRLLPQVFARPTVAEPRSFHDLVLEAMAEVEAERASYPRREFNLLRYLEFDYEVDDAASGLCAVMEPRSKAFGWQLEIRCTRAHVKEHSQPAHLEGPYFAFGGTWRELSGQELRIQFEEAEHHPLLPSNPGGIYVGWHAFPNQHQIRFLSRVGNRFVIDWKCQAREAVDDPGNPVWVYAEIAFKEVIVSCPEEEISEDNARRALRQRFDVNDFDQPSRQAWGEGCRFRFPVRSDIA